MVTSNISTLVLGKFSHTSKIISLQIFRMKKKTTLCYRSEYQSHLMTHVASIEDTYPTRNYSQKPLKCLLCGRRVNWNDGMTHKKLTISRIFDFTKNTIIMEELLLVQDFFYVGRYKFQ